MDAAPPLPVCDAEIADCLEDAACAAALPCLETCVNEGGEGCTFECMPEPFNDTLYDLGVCGGEAGCGNICGDGSCGPGESFESCPEDCDEPASEGCGDGICKDGETFEDCPADCPAPEETFSCLVESCDTAACLDFPVCEAAVE